MALRPFHDRNSKAGSRRTIGGIAKSCHVDERALHILFSAFRDYDDRKNAVTDGWIRGRGIAEQDIPVADYEYAVAQGVLLPPRTLTPEQVRTWYLDQRSKLPDEAAIGAAFMFSLVCGGQNYRSALGTYACFQAVTADTFDHIASDVGLWGLPEEKTELSLAASCFWRFYGPSVGLHENVIYAAVDFEMFNKQPTAEVTEQHRTVMKQVLDAIRALPPSAQLSELNKSLTGIVKGNKYQRQHLLEVLGYSDVLQPSSQPPMANRYCRLSDCPLPSSYYKKEWRYPVCWWTGQDGVNEAAVARWFPGLERS